MLIATVILSNFQDLFTKVVVMFFIVVIVKVLLNNIVVKMGFNGHFMVLLLHYC